MIDKLKTKINERISMLLQQGIEYTKDKNDTKAIERANIAGHLGMVLKDLEGFDDYLETYFEIVGGIFLAMNSQEPNLVRLEYEKHGRGAMYNLAKEWTDEFHSLHSDTEWDGDWIEVLEEFFNNKNELK